VQVQGPKAKDVMRDLFGEWILDMKYYWCDEADLDGIPVVISRTGWTAIPGFEVNLLDFSRGDELWDAILEAGEPTPALALAYAASAEDRTFQGAIDEALGLAERAVDLADRLGAEDVGIMARELLGNARCELGDRAGLDLLHEALRMALDAGNSGEAAVAYSWLGEWAWQVDGPASGLETLRRCRELAERRVIRNQIVWAKAESTWMLFDAGDWDELLRVAAEAVEGDRIVHGGGQPGAAAATFQALVQAHRGDLAQALAALRALARPAREMDPQVTVPALGALAFAEHASGNAAEALDLLREIEEATRGQAGGYRQLQAPDAVRIAVAEGDLDLAERFVSGSVDAVPRRRLAVQTGETILAEARGDTAGAFGRFEDLSRAWAEYGHPLERGRALLGAGRCLLQLSREVEAAEPLRSARSVFEALGATSLAADADGLLETTEV
jgi:tetratricopeptide (TPR) repeat protein